MNLRHGVEVTCANVIIMDRARYVIISRMDRSHFHNGYYFGIRLSIFFLEYAGELRIIILYNKEEKKLQTMGRTHTQQNSRSGTKPMGREENTSLITLEQAYSSRFKQPKPVAPAFTQSLISNLIDSSSCSVFDDRRSNSPSRGQHRIIQHCHTGPII